MKLDKEELATLDLTAAHEKALEAHEQLERLAKIADDPDAYTVAEYQAAMDAAKYLEQYWGSGPIASEAEEVVAAFVARVEAKRACREHGLVPQAKYDEICAQLEQAKAAQASIGIGDPKPPPPPPTKAREASREPVPALTLDDLAEAWTSAAIDRVIGYGPSSELLAALNEALARKSQP